MAVARYFEDERDPWRRVRAGVAVLVATLAAGTVANKLLGLSWINAFYQTIITVTTVGYGEIPPDSGPISDTYRLVNSVLVLVGVAVGVYTLGGFFEVLLDGRLSTHFGRVRMQREVDQLTDHIVICGAGQVGEAIARAIDHHGEQVVMIDQRDDIHEAIEFLTVRGDATDDGTLHAAGIDRARGLVTALDTDADNLFVTISARTIKPSLYIVSRANESGNVNKLLAGGADRVVNPHEIGGVRMASFMVQPNVADFLGESMSDARFEVRLAETRVIDGSPLAACSLDESGVVQRCGVTILAIRHPDGSFVHQPSPESVPLVGDVVISLGTKAQQTTLRTWAGNGTADSSANRSGRADSATGGDDAG